jgi:hypothetical protein
MNAVRKLLAAAPIAFLTFALLTVTGCDDKNPGAPVGDDVPPAFAHSAACVTCHPQQVAEWESSRHAYSSADPVMHELAKIAGAELKEVCKQCHAPGQQRMEQLLAIGKGDPALDFSNEGMNCDVCHSISEIPPTATAAFLHDVDPTGPKYANMPETVDTPAHGNERRTWYGTSVACAPCHQFDLADGTNLENTFIEWEASSLSGLGFECQTCHMPTYTGQAAVTGPVRQGLHSHKFVGVDYAYEAFRGIDLQAQKDDIRLLLENSVSVTASGIPGAVTAGSQFTLDVTVLNDKTGHAIPSGVSFAREMWIEVLVTDSGGGTVYRSGWLQANDDLVTAAQDPDLNTFSAQMYDADGQPTGFAWEAASIDESGLLQYLDSRTASYVIAVPPGTAGPLTVDVALRFRSLAPAGPRSLGLDRILPIEVFDMWRETHQVGVS